MEHAALDGGDFLAKELLAALESPQLLTDDCYLSLHAMSGQSQSKAIQLRALVHSQALVILVDSGSSHTFLNLAIVDKLQLQTTSVHVMNIRVANGSRLSCTADVKHFKWWIHGHTFQVDAKVINMGAYDLVLGTDRLEKFRPMTCDWLERWIEFEHKMLK
jgi:hypothetical protein